MRLHHARRSASAAACGRCPALRTDELRHKLRAEPDQSTRDNCRTGERRANDGRPTTACAGRRGAEVVARGAYEGKACRGRPHGADHRDRQRQDQPGQSGGLGLAGPPAQRAAGENSIRRVADGSKRHNRRQSQTEGPRHRHGAEASRDSDAGALLDADPELPGS